jgi:hypothetical protein
MAKSDKKTAKKASETFHNIMKASVTPKKNNSVENKEHEITLPDGEKVYVMETTWRGKRRLIVDSDTGKYTFALTEAGDGPESSNLSSLQKSAADYILKKINGK